MRLICPNCGAQYEVDDSLIPEAGRDVQCSNCGNAWFQRPAHLDDDLTEELGGEPASAKPTLPPGDPDEDQDAAEAPETRAVDILEDPAEDTSDDNADADDDAEDDDDDAAASLPVAAAGKMPEVDEGVRNILREEAERESQARNSERAGIETQEDLGLGDAPEQRSVGVRQRMARLRGLDVDERAEGAAAAVAAATAAGSRRELLPDIEEINSSLRSAEERDDMLDALDDEPQSRRRRGFGTGFLLVLLVALAALAIYVLSDRIAEAVPSMSDPLAAYTAWVDKSRIAIDGLAQDWVRKITEMLQQVNDKPE